MVAKVKVYTTNYCPYCKKAKALLTDLDADFEEIDITDNEDDAMDRLFAITGRSTVPQIFIDDKFIGGCDDMFEMHRAGELMELLK